ncbi:MAG TPA: inorganic phosphate transporter [Gemmatales bacterium]|nr:inorganic phosphate transporter [Gemmatales bacterium]
MIFWDAVGNLATPQMIFFFVALAVAFGFEFINGFHDTANAVTTVIYTRTLKPTASVVYSGFMNFLGVLLGGTAVAFSIVNLLPVDLLVDANSASALGMVLSILLAGVTWNLGTWYFGLPVSSSHTLIGSILGVGLANSLLQGQGITGINWSKAGEVGLALLLSPVVGFALSALLLLFMKMIFPDKRLYVPPVGEEKPPGWIRTVLIATCGAVSFAHGSNDGQKGMGLLLLVLIGFLPVHHALNTRNPEEAQLVHDASLQLKKVLADKEQTHSKLFHDLNYLDTRLQGVHSLDEVKNDDRWEVRQAIFRTVQYLNKNPDLKSLEPQWRKHRQQLTSAIEYVPLWVVIGTALALGIGTTVGYKRIVVTVAEKIGKSHLTYAQGAAAELVAAITILLATLTKAPVSTTQVLSSGIAGTMVANGSGIQRGTTSRILLAWCMTLPATMLIGGLFFFIGRLFVR